KKELAAQTDRIKYNKLAGAKTDQEDESLNFIYAPPPGYQQMDEGDEGEDEEVKKFKMLAKMKQDPNFSAAANSSELEKLVGRRVNPGVSLAEQQERFSFLKGAPVEHAFTSSVKVNFKPFNNIVRHIKCTRCGEWGHRAGERECKMRDQNPNDRERLIREDPLSYMNKGSGEGGTTQGPDKGKSNDPDQEFLARLSSKEKRKLLKKLQELEDNPEVSAKELEDNPEVSAKEGGDRGGGERKKRKRKKEKKSNSKDKKRKRRKEG
ncbi:unnamed protein product, partial [Discosporangium mesarthrocarpum]